MPIDSQSNFSPALDRPRDRSSALITFTFGIKVDLPPNWSENLISKRWPIPLADFTQTLTKEVLYLVESAAYAHFFRFRAETDFAILV